MELSEISQSENAMSVGLQLYDVLDKAKLGDIKRVSGCRVCGGVKMNGQNTEYF